MAYRNHTEQSEAIQRCKAVFINAFRQPTKDELCSDHTAAALGQRLWEHEGKQASTDLTPLDLPTSVKFNIVVHIHLGARLQLSDEFEEYCQSIVDSGLTYQFYVTVFHESDQREIMDRWGKFAPLSVLVVKNAGFDIGPFFEVLWNMINKGESCDVIMKWQSKRKMDDKTPGVVFQIRREEIHRALACSPQRVRHVFSLLTQNSTIGLVGSNQTTVKEDPRITGLNSAWLETIAVMMKVAPWQQHEQHFVAGTVFAAKFDCISIWYRFREQLEQLMTPLDAFDWAWYCTQHRVTESPFNALCLQQTKQDLFAEFPYGGNTFQAHAKPHLASRMHPRMWQKMRDSTSVHAVERLFGYLARRMGYSIKGLDLDECPASDQPD